VTGRRVLLATRSEGKLREMRRIFAEFGLDAIDAQAAGLDESAAEDDLEAFDTFEENALAKARYFFERADGMPTFADDSGLCVDILSGEPGVMSKRWAGRNDLSGKSLDDANNAKLIARMKEARAINSPDFTDAGVYVCVAVFKDAKAERISRGEMKGRLLSEPRGTGGFGYDPYFEAPDVGGTFAELSIEQTARMSHRSRAFRALLSALREEGRI
jgi:XTP/dITP diphosphohydrolase